MGKETAECQKLWAWVNGFEVVHMIKGKRDGVEFEGMLAIAKMVGGEAQETYELVNSSVFCWAQELRQTYAPGTLEVVVEVLRQEYVVMLGDETGFGVFRVSNMEYGRGFGARNKKRA